jgi:hypothetical protein
LPLIKGNGKANWSQEAFADRIGVAKLLLELAIFQQYRARFCSTR